MKTKIFARKNLGWILPLSTILWFTVFYFLTRNLTVASIGGIAVGFVGTVLWVANGE